MMASNPSKKRKTIDDFFVSATQRPKPLPASYSKPPRTYNGTRGVHVPGLELHRNFITEAEEQTILNFLNDTERCQWRSDLSRRTMHFGGSYCLMPPKSVVPLASEGSTPEIIQAPPMPDELSWLIQRFVDGGIFDERERPQYCIVNEYVSSQGISAHTENFQFSEPVVGLSLVSACPIRFHELVKPFDGSVRSGRAGKAEKTGRRIDVQMPARSLLVMREQSRWQWQHEILRSQKGRGEGWKRVSLTFRHKAQAGQERYVAAALDRSSRQDLDDK